MRKEPTTKAPGANRGLRPRLWSAAAIAALGAAVLSGCNRESPPNVIVVLIDTLRADRVGWYGGDKRLTPFLDGLAEHGTVLWSAYAQSSWTCPSVASLFTSRYQSQHKVVAHGSVVAADELTLAEALAQDGYATGAFVGNRVLSARLGYDQGFATYRVFPSDLSETEAADWTNLLVKGDAKTLESAALEWVDSQPPPPKRPPLFLYMHYMEVHQPYSPPPEIVDEMIGRLGDEARFRPLVARVCRRCRRVWVMREQRAADHNPWTAPTADELAVIESLYDAEVRDLDNHLRDFFASLEQRGVLKNAIVVVAADHGEEFMEHGNIGHGGTLYEELIHVPLLIVAPGGGPRTDVAEVVSLLDVAPTLLDLAGLEVPGAFEGRSLRWTTSGWRRWLARGRRALGLGGHGGEVGYAELVEPLAYPKAPRQTEAVVRGAQKMIVLADGERLFYDLATDPGERSPVDSPDPKAEASLQSALDQVRRVANSRASKAETKPLDEETRERLRALGYDPH